MRYVSFLCCGITGCTGVTRGSRLVSFGVLSCRSEKPLWQCHRMTFSFDLSCASWGPGPETYIIPYPGGRGFGMSLSWIVLVCSGRRRLADRHSLPFPWTLSLRRRWCPSASHRPVSFLHLLGLSFPLYFPFPGPCGGWVKNRSKTASQQRIVTTTFQCCGHPHGTCACPCKVQ